MSGLHLLSPRRYRSLKRLFPDRLETPHLNLIYSVPIRYKALQARRQVSLTSIHLIPVFTPSYGSGGVGRISSVDTLSSKSCRVDSLFCRHILVTVPGKKTIPARSKRSAIIGRSSQSSEKGVLENIRTMGKGIRLVLLMAVFIFIPRQIEPKVHR